MASLGPGRKRTPNKNGITPEEDALNVIAREAEARLTAKRAARAEAREIRMKELERQQKEIYQVQKKYYGLENLDNKCWEIEQWMEDSEQYIRHSQQHVSVSGNEEGKSAGTGSSLQGSSQVSTLSTDTLTSLGGVSSNKGSGSSSVTANTETSIRDTKEIQESKDQIRDVEIKYMQSLKEAKDSLSEMEMKYRKAMVSNAQLDNEKSNLMYEVDSLKDSLMELEELLSETLRKCEEKNNDLEREKHAHSILHFQFSKQKETLKQNEELLTEIRQLHIKQDGFIREISDLQETVKWKEKKIGASEKQRDFSDAIRNERDELREEVVQLKDILKKHGIALGSELCTNGEVGVNVSGGPACTVLKHGSSVLGTQKLQLFRDENLGGFRRDQLQYPQEFDHGIEENHLPSPATSSSFNSRIKTQYEAVGLGIYLTNSMLEIQNNVQKTQAVFEPNTKEQIVLEILKGNDVPETDANIMKGIGKDQEGSSPCVKRSETGKEGNHDYTYKFTCERSEKGIQLNFDENVFDDTRIKMSTYGTPLAKTDTKLNSQSASVSVKNKKKRKNKQKRKQKHSCDGKSCSFKNGGE